MTEFDPVTAGGGLTIAGGALYFIRQLIAKTQREGKDNAVHGAGSDATTGLIATLQGEAKKWQERHDEIVKQHEENIELIALLRSQNAMLRLILIQKGVTTEELTAIGVIV